MKLPQVFGVHQRVQVDHSIFPPEFHLFVLQDCVLDIGLDEELLIVHVHSVNNIFDVEFLNVEGISNMNLIYHPNPMDANTFFTDYFEVL